MLGYEYLGRTDLVHVLDKPEILNTGADDWDEVPSNPLEYVPHELSNVRITPSSGAAGTQPIKNQRTAQTMKMDSSVDAMNAMNKGMQGDAPACTNCGHITIRSGTCYKCLNCGTQGGCS